MNDEEFIRSIRRDFLITYGLAVGAILCGVGALILRVIA